MSTVVRGYQLTITLTLPLVSGHSHTLQCDNHQDRQGHLKALEVTDKMDLGEKEMVELDIKPCILQ